MIEDPARTDAGASSMPELPRGGGLPEAGGAGLQDVLPPDLERYLPANLWNKLIADSPRRGVLLNALDRLRSILYLVSTYLPAHLVQEKMRHPVPDLVRGQMLSGCLLFTDVSGFTALSERLASLSDGAEQLTKLMNQYFERMLTILSRSGGTLLKFAGDALVAYFPGQKDGEQARLAVRAAQRMIGATSDFTNVPTPDGAVDLQMKIGISTGHFLAASVGNVGRMEYVILGETVARTLAAEGHAPTGQIVVDSTTAAHLDPATCVEQTEDRFFSVHDTAENLDDYEIRIEKRRARGAIPWSASRHAIATQMEIALRQIKALAPFLPPDLMERIVGSAIQRQVESEHRPATVLFVNFCGLEPLLAAWGKEGVRQVTRLLDDYFRAMQRVIARHGGIVSRIDPYSRGSKMLVLFGAPVAHEEQPLRAVSAALAMNAELAALNDRWRRQLDRHLLGLREPASEQVTSPSQTADLDAPLIEQRIGITRGQTFAGQAGSLTRREYTVMGDDVNLAARLMAAARPGQILLSQRVYDAVADHFSATALPSIRVKGKSRPIPIYLPTGPRDDPLARRLRERGYLIGRDAELEMGRAAIWRVLNGRGGILLIEGPAGVGKSRLADELAAYALARGVNVVFSPCRSYAAHAAYAPWITLLQSLMGITPGTPLDDHSRGTTLLRVLNDLGLPAAEYANPLAVLLGLPRSFPSPDSMPPLPASPEARPPAVPTGPPQGATLFARLEQKVSRQEGAERDLWRLVKERRGAQGNRLAQPGQMWHNLQGRIAARQQEQLFAAVCGLLHRISAQAPLLLFFESAQWMDPASRALLDFLGEELRQVPILALMVQRGEGGAAPSGDEEGAVEEAAAQIGGWQTVTLKPLSQAGTAALVHHLLGEEVQTALAGVIHQLSGGNPLFIEEILHWLQRTGQSTTDGLGDGLRVSTTLQELVLSHLDSLPPGQRDTVKAASVIGSEFLRGEIHTLLPPTTDAEVLDDHLDGLEKARLILLTQSDPSVCYAFRQTLVREVVYSSQSFARRRELHACLASYLETCLTSDVAQQAELLAHHYELAERPLPAARYLVLSADKARQRHAYPQAADYYSRTLAILAHLLAGEADEADASAKTLGVQAREGLGDIAVLTGDFPAAVAEYVSLVEDASGRLLLKLAQVLPTQDRASTAEAYARQAWATHESDIELTAAATLAWLLWRAGDARAGNWIERGRELAAHSPDPWAGGMMALLADLAGDWSQAQQAYLTLGQPIGAALVACREGDRHLLAGDAARALELYGQAAALWDRENDACGLALARYCQAGVYLQSGDATAGRNALEETLSLLDAAQTDIQDERLSIQQALAALEVGQTVSWSPWQWQCYDDAFRISMLFQPWSR